MKVKPKSPAKHRFAPRRPWHRNDRDPDRVDEVPVPEHLLVPAPFTSMVPYDRDFAANQVRAASLPRATLTKRAAAAARAKVAALKPEIVNPFNRAHLLGVAASAGGGLAASLAGRQLGDDVGEKNLAIGLTALGALGTVFLTDHWHRIAAGVLAGGMSQYAGAYLTERAERQLAKERKLRVDAERAVVAALNAQPAAPPAVGKPAAPPRNAYAANDNDVYGAVDRAHRAVDAMLWDERNSHGVPYGGDVPYADDERNGYVVSYGDDDDERNGYGVPYQDGAIDLGLMEAYAA